MAFVKDDHGYTRGPGAIAAMDAASPARRLAAARAERALRMREVLTQGAIETGQEAAFSRPPPSPPPRPPGGRPMPPRRPLPFRPKGLDVIGGKIAVPTKPTVKLPGTVITPPTRGEVKPTQTATPTLSPTPLPLPPKTVTTVVGGGSGTSWTAPPRTPPPGMDLENPPPAWAPEPEIAAPAAPTASPAKPASSKILLYAAIGIGAWWLLTRK